MAATKKTLEPELDVTEETVTAEETGNIESEIEIAETEADVEVGQSVSAPPGRIITQDKYDRGILDSGAEKERTATMLSRAVRNQTILQGIISGVEESGGYSYVVLYADENKVIIPFDQLGISARILSEESGRDRERNLADSAFRMIGARIDYIPLSVEQNIVVASRAMAMKQLREGYYLAQADREPVIRAGSVVEARIVEKRYNRLKVELFGMEAWIRLRDVSHIWYADLTEMDFPDDRILVRVIECHMEDTEPWLSASAKEAGEDQRMPRLRQLSIGSMYSGTVTGIHKENFYVRTDNGANVICYMEGGSGIPAIGDRVIFRLGHVDDRMKMGIGRIRKVNKKI